MPLPSAPVRPGQPLRAAGSDDHRGTCLAETGGDFETSPRDPPVTIATLRKEIEGCLTCISFESDRVRIIEAAARGTLRGTLHGLRMPMPLRTVERMRRKPSRRPDGLLGQRFRISAPVTPSSPSPSTMRRSTTRLADDPAHRDLAVVVGSRTAIIRGITRFPNERRSAEAQRAHRAGDLPPAALSLVAHQGDRHRRTVALMRVAGVDRQRKHERLGRRVASRLSIDTAVSNDLAVAVAQTDVKGDRSLGPSAAADPDLYVHIVDRRRDGIVVRGAEGAHVGQHQRQRDRSCLPTRAMGEADRDYAVSFAVPIATPRFNAPRVGATTLPARRPRRRAPHQRSTQDDGDDDGIRGRVRAVGARLPRRRSTSSRDRWRSRFVEHHRFTAISYKLPLVDALIGSAMLMADMNGIAKAGTSARSWSQLISYGQTLRGRDSLRGDQRVATRTGNLRARSTLS